MLDDTRRAGFWIHCRLDIKLQIGWLERRHGEGEFVFRQYISGSDTRQLERVSRVLRRQQAIDRRESRQKESFQKRVRKEGEIDLAVLLARSRRSNL